MNLYNLNKYFNIAYVASNMLKGGVCHFCCSSMNDDKNNDCFQTLFPNTPV